MFYKNILQKHQIGAKTGLEDLLSVFSWIPIIDKALWLPPRVMNWDLDPENKIYQVDRQCQ